MRIPRWRWVLIPMIVVVSGCLPQPTPDLPGSLLQNLRGSAATFSVQTPPAGETGQDIAAALVAKAPADAMFRGRAVPVYLVIDCHGTPGCSPAAAGSLGGPVAIWVLLYPGCTGSAPGDFGWVIVDAVAGLEGGYSAYDYPCVH